MGNVESEDISQVTERASFLFDTIQGSQFRISIDLQQYLKSPVIYVVAQDLLSLERTILKYSINPELVRCDENLLEIKEIKDMSDSCAEVTILYHGIGDVFVLGAATVDEMPETKTIISDGIYLGKLPFSLFPLMLTPKSCGKDGSLRNLSKFRLYVLRHSDRCAMYSHHCVKIVCSEYF